MCVYFCVCVERNTLSICLCSSSSSCDSASLIRNIGKFRVKSYFADHRTAYTVQYTVLDTHFRSLKYTSIIRIPKI